LRQSRCVPVSFPYLDEITIPATGTYPWYDSNNTSGIAGQPPQYVAFKSFPSDLKQNAPISQSFQMSDEPHFPATVSAQLLDGPPGGITSFGILLNFQDYFAAQTTDTENGANTNYVDLASANWIFNGSGQVSNSVTGMAGTWQPTNAAHENTTDGTHTSGTFAPATPGASVSLPSGFLGADTPANNVIFDDNAHNWTQVPIPPGG
jgi:hypothetical protein